MSGDSGRGTGLLIANLFAGEKDPALVDAAARSCSALLSGLSVVRTACPGHAEELAGGALGAGYDVVIALGGDGTVREVATGMVRSGSTSPAATAPPLMIIPAGTGNSFYRELWADRPWAESLTLAFSEARSRVRRIDMARIHETGDLVLLGACSGLVAEALVTAGELTDFHGRDRYQQAVALTLRDFSPHPGRVTVDGRQIHDGSVVLANVGGGRFRGGRFLLLPHSVLDDGLLDVCVVTGSIDPRELPGLTRGGGHVGRPGVVYERGRRIVIERTDGRPLTFEHDGEVQSDPGSRYTIEVLPGALPVLAPLAVPGTRNSVLGAATRTFHTP